MKLNLRYILFGMAGGCLVLALFSQWMRLPISFQGVWMSPDETANALSAAAFADHANFALPYGLADGFPWAVPRSFVPMVGQGTIVPVGFLGLSFILAGIYKLLGALGLLFFTPLLALATLWPLYRSMPRVWSKAARYMALLVWMSFPVVILYANRGLFPNLALVCLAIWTWWLLAEAKGIWSWPIAGLTLGMALMMRPPEAVWLIPLAVAAVVASVRQSANDKPASPSRTSGPADQRTRLKLRLMLLVVPLLMVLGVGAYLGRQTYGHWFISGYQVRPDYAAVTAKAVATSTVVAEAQTVPVWQTLPFSLHPKNIIWNAWHYLGRFLWPWTLLVLVWLGFWVKDKGWSKSDKWTIGALAWTAVWLVAFYGNGIYQDHVGVNYASMGNSYLRYLLPLSVLAALTFGSLANRLWKSWTTRALAICLVVMLVAVGSWSALTRDDESVQANQAELARYADIRRETQTWLWPQTVVLSDRSDKIFFPSFPAVSPLPDPKSIKALLDKELIVTAFLTTQDEAGLRKWEDDGLYLELLFTNGRQSLYDVSE
jgi:hypothetical protein